ncbi:hypothetical protein [Anaerococcus prevotii]|uniref:hypothetical protein n=1 Tax=Anaerococcus prevotii TaxID=33034 RepID=UPI002804FE89|nr:hypothetical protein [Anaerococcus prevotii]MDU2557830.1 hypothetical protein [Anaerococcus prevotii]MDU2584119.1 hypothetical protein [Anaerococcus prevotii]MDU3137186.1 hypothetical protein [Anaerococcus prevotii]
MDDIRNLNIVDLQKSYCPGCPSCDKYNNCYCDFLGYPIVEYAISDWAKSGYKIKSLIDRSAGESGVITPYRR